MIIIGYQGIGKSTLSSKGLKYIDLESSNFWENNARPLDWYIYYCKIAENLSKQGYVVCVSSHEVVRNYLKDNCKEDVICIYPSILLRDQWVEKLKSRYDETQASKDFKAWANADDCYHENIAELMNSGFLYAEINSMDYDLEAIIDTVIKNLQQRSEDNSR